MKKTENAAQARPTTHNQSATVILALIMALALTFAIAIIPSAHAVEGTAAPIQVASTPTGPAVPIENLAASNASAAEAIADEETPLASFAQEQDQFSWAQGAVLVAVLAVVVACGLTVVKRRRDEVRRLDCFESHISGR